jgi:RNA-directed DNA polymerase
MATSLPALEPAGPVGTACVKERGRARHPEKTRMVQRPEGGDSLGCHGPRRGQTLLITPQQQKGQALLQASRAWVNTQATVTAAVVMPHLTPRMRGGAMYDRHVVRQHTFPHVDDHSWRALWRGVTRRPPKQPTRWRYRRDCAVGQYGATFSTASRARCGQTRRLRLERRPTLPIVRHVQVKGRARPDEPTLQAYWETRRLRRGRHRGARGGMRYGMAAAQRWPCPGWGQALFDGPEGHRQHRIPVHAGGSDGREHLPWLPATGPRQRPRQGVTAGQSA